MRANQLIVLLLTPVFSFLGGSVLLASENMDAPSTSEVQPIDWDKVLEVPVLTEDFDEEDQVPSDDGTDSAKIKEYWKKNQFHRSPPSPKPPGLKTPRTKKGTVPYNGGELRKENPSSTGGITHSWRLWEYLGDQSLSPFCQFAREHKQILCVHIQAVGWFCRTAFICD